MANRGRDGSDRVARRSRASVRTVVGKKPGARVEGRHGLALATVRQLPIAMADGEHVRGAARRAEKMVQLGYTPPQPANGQFIKGRLTTQNELIKRNHSKRTEGFSTCMLAHISALPPMNKTPAAPVSKSRRSPQSADRHRGNLCRERKRREARTARTVSPHCRLRPGDVVLIEQVDRLSRLSGPDWTKLRAELDAKQIRVVAMDLPTSWMMAAPADDFTGRMFTAINSMLLDMLAAVARKDFEDRRRRQTQGIAKAKAEGLYRGRPEDVGRNAGIASMLKAGTPGPLSSARSDALERQSPRSRSVGRRRSEGREPLPPRSHRPVEERWLFVLADKPRDCPSVLTLWRLHGLRRRGATIALISMSMALPALRWPSSHGIEPHVGESAISAIASSTRSAFAAWRLLRIKFL